jgi:transposase
MERLFVGLDVHKEKIVCAGFAIDGREPVWREDFVGSDISRLVKRLASFAKKGDVVACYEAGPCGYGLARALLSKGVDCRIVAPSLVPKRPGDRVKTDARDARELALALRAQTLTFVRIPNDAEESVRGLVRCREDVAKEVRRFKHVVSHWLLTRGYRKPGGVGSWSPAHWRWMRGLELPSMDRGVLDHYLDSLRLLADRLKIIEGEIEALAETEEYRERVARLRAFRGFSVLGAMRMIAEVVEFTRFGRATSFMKYVGLTPSEYSSSDRVRRGRITKAGNSLVRHVLVEAVQTLRRASAGKALLERMNAVTGPLRDIAVKCLGRLRSKYLRLLVRGIPAGKAKVAMARELAGFVWAMMTAAPSEG